MNNDTLKLAKSQAKANENPKVALLPFEIIYFLDPSYYPKLIWDILKNVQKTNVPVLIRLYDKN